MGWSVEIVQHAPSERGEWRYIRDESGTLQGTYVRYAPEPKGFKGILPRRWCALSGSCSTECRRPG